MVVSRSGGGRSACWWRGRTPLAKPLRCWCCGLDSDERKALLAGGHPFFPSRAGRDRIGVVLDDDTDWTEIRELVTDSYRILAPKKLSALLD